MMPGYANWGVGFDLDRFPMDITDNGHTNSRTVSVYGISWFMEKEWATSGLGLKVGLGQSQTVDAGYSSNVWFIHLPITAYYKYKVTPRFHLYGGAGVSYFFVETDVTDNIVKDLALHLQGGAEWYAQPWWSLGLRLNTTSDANVNKRSGSFRREVDMSGFSWGLFTKIYF